MGSRDREAVGEVIHEDATETARKVRQALKERFPGVAFSVRTDKYAGGSSVDVRWTDGPLQREVEEVVERFESCTFDGMTDSTIHHGYEWEGKRYSGADYVQCQRELSEGYRARLEKVAKERFADFDRDDYRYWQWLQYAEEAILEHGKDGEEEVERLEEKLAVVLKREKETKHTVRFDEPESDEAPIIGTVYVQKYALRRLGNPEKVRVTIEPA